MVSSKSNLRVLLGAFVVDAVKQEQGRLAERERSDLQRAGDVVGLETHLLHGLRGKVLAPDDIALRRDSPGGLSWGPRRRTLGVQCAQGRR